MDVAIELNNINKSINEKRILNNISFKLFNNKITALLGPNGSGKTTTMKILSKLIEYDSGSVIINKELKYNHNNIMLVFDEPILYEELTGSEHLNFNIELFNIKITEEKKNEYINLFKIEEFMDTEIYKYSLGTKKKLQLLCTLINKPKILLLDEYISGLDPLSLYNIKIILRNYAEQGNSILLATHMLEVAEKFCDDAIMINEGMVVNEGVTNIEEIKSKFGSLENFYIKSLKKLSHCSKKSIS